MFQMINLMLLMINKVQKNLILQEILVSKKTKETKEKI